MPQYYVAGGMYKRYEQDRNYEFALVSPSGNGSLPYVWTDPLPFQTLTEHHASLYKLGDDGKTLTLYARGKLRDHDPSSHVLNYKQTEDVRARIASGEVYKRE